MNYLEDTRPVHPFTDGHHLQVYNKKRGYVHSLCDSQLFSAYDINVKRPGRDDLHLFHWGEGYSDWLKSGLATVLHNGIELCPHCAIRHSLIIANGLRIGRPHGLRQLKKLEKGV